MKTEIITLQRRDDDKQQFELIGLVLHAMTPEDQAGADRDFQIYGSCVTHMDEHGRRVWVPMKDYRP